MNPFVNFQKRDIELPAGCKDLIDVLRIPKGEPVSSFASCPVEGLTDLAKHLSVLLEPGTKSKSLVTTWHQMNYLHLMNEKGLLSALTVVHENTRREEAVRAVFGGAGLVPTHDQAVAGGSVRMMRFLLPSSASSIEELISDLLRTGYGLAQNVSLEFRCREYDYL